MSNLKTMKDAANELIETIECELSGVRDGDGYWHGSDPVHGSISEMGKLTSAWMAESRHRRSGIYDFLDHWQIGEPRRSELLEADANGDPLPSDEEEQYRDHIVDFAQSRVPGHMKDSLAESIKSDEQAFLNWQGTFQQIYTKEERNEQLHAANIILPWADESDVVRTTGMTGTSQLPRTYCANEPASSTPPTPPWAKSKPRRARSYEERRSQLLKNMIDKPMQELNQIDGFLRMDGGDDVMQPDENGVCLMGGSTEDLYNAPWDVRLYVKRDVSKEDLVNTLKPMLEWAERDVLADIQKDG